MEDNQDSKQPIEKIYRSRKTIMLNNFLGGIAWALGSLVGASIVIAIIGFFLSKVDLIPIIGSWLADLISQSNLQEVLMKK